MSDSRLNLLFAFLTPLRCLVLCGIFCVCAWQSAYAQQKRDPFQMPLALDPWNERDAKTHQLRIIEQDLFTSTGQQADIQSRLLEARTGREALTQSLAKTGQIIRKIESDVVILEARLQDFEKEERNRRLIVRSKHKNYAEILAKMQKIAVNPPPALLVSSQDTLSSVRSAILLEAVIPKLRSETAVLSENLDRLSLLRHNIEEDRIKLSSELKKLTQSKQEIAQLLEQKKRIETQSEADIAQNQKRIDQLVAQSETLKDLIARLETDINATNAQAKLKNGVKGGVGGPELASAFQKPQEAFSSAIKPEQKLARLKFESTQGQLLPPVVGVRVRNFGDLDASGASLRGIVFATRATTHVVAPTAGIVLYAGPFRSYGQLLILNLGSGYHMLIAGLEKIYALPGNFVEANEPIGEMGIRAAATMAAFAASTSDTAQPIVYVELRKDGQSIDPSPWWKSINKEEVKG